MRHTASVALLALLLAAPAAAGATELSRPLILAATAELNDPVYRATVLVVAPLGAARHIGFIVNRPTRLTLARLFPQHAPSQKVAEPVFLGGPVNTEAIFALVARPDSPGGSSLELAPGLYAAFDAPTVDRIIETNPDHARFLAGAVLWRPGELAREIELGAWYVLDCDPALVMRDPQGLWEELVLRARRMKDMLRTGAHR